MSESGVQLVPWLLLNPNDLPSIILHALGKEHIFTSVGALLGLSALPVWRMPPSLD